MNQYNSYKPSGVKWLGDIPSHWEVLPGLAVIKENKEKNSKLEFNTVLSLSYGNIVIKKDINEGLVPAEYNTYQIVKPGYIIIRCTDLQNDKTSLRTGLVKNEGIITSAYLGLVVDEKYNAPYIHYFLHTWDITKEIYRHGSGLRQSLSWLDLKRLPILLPPTEEQDAIVNYLDAATAKIDTAIAQQQKMIDLLNERKQIIINSVVTRGLDPNVKMKDSCVEWIGEIPEHWEVVPMRRFLDVRDGTHDTPSYLPRSKNTYPLITSKDFIEGEISFEDVKWISFNDFVEIDKRSHVDKYDVLTSMIGGNIGKSVIVKKDIKIAIKNVALFKTNGDYNLAKFIYYYMIGGLIKTQVEINSRGGAQAFLGLNDMRNLVYFDIPIRERNQIVDYLDFRLGAIDKIIGNCNKQITLLQERKQIIINDVVTGKVKVS